MTWTTHQSASRTSTTWRRLRKCCRTLCNARPSEYTRNRTSSFSRCKSGVEKCKTRHSLPSEACVSGGLTVDKFSHRRSTHFHWTRLTIFKAYTQHTPAHPLIDICSKPRSIVLVFVSAKWIQKLNWWAQWWRLHHQSCHFYLGFRSVWHCWAILLRRCSTKFSWTLHGSQTLESCTATDSSTSWAVRNSVRKCSNTWRRRLSSTSKGWRWMWQWRRRRPKCGHCECTRPVLTLLRWWRTCGTCPESLETLGSLPQVLWERKQKVQTRLVKVITI